VHNLTTASQAAPYTMLNILKANNANPQVTDNWNPLTTINSTGRVALVPVAEAPELNDDRFRLYPSPADQEITIQTGGVLDKDARIVIYDNLGRQVLESALKGIKSTFNVGSFSPGIYTIKVFNGQHLITKKFMKK
jgi:hypothetical protein